MRQRSSESLGERLAPVVALLCTLGAAGGLAAQEVHVLGPDEHGITMIIEAVSPTEYRISRSVLAPLGTRREQLVRFLSYPLPDDRGPQGIKLYGVRRRGFLGRLGFQNGDLVRTINGLTLQEGHQNHRQLVDLTEHARVVDVGLTRRHADVHLRYHIND